MKFYSSVLSETFTCVVGVCSWRLWCYLCWCFLLFILWTGGERVFTLVAIKRTDSQRMMMIMMMMMMMVMMMTMITTNYSHWLQQGLTPSDRLPQGFFRQTSIGAASEARCLSLRQWLNSDLMYLQLHNAQLHYERYVDFLTWCTLSSLWIVGDIVPSSWSDSGLDWVAPQVLLLGNVTSWDDCEVKSTHHFSRSSCASWISKEILSSQLPATAPHCRHQTIMSLLNWTLHSFHLDPSRTWIEHGFPKVSSIWLCLALQSRSFLPPNIQHERHIWKIRTKNRNVTSQWGA